jgi:hypothetical protein
VSHDKRGSRGWSRSIRVTFEGTSEDAALALSGMMKEMKYAFLQDREALKQLQHEQQQLQLQQRLDMNQLLNQQRRITNGAAHE